MNESAALSVALEFQKITLLNECYKYKCRFVRLDLRVTYLQQSVSHYEFDQCMYACLVAAWKRAFMQQ